MRWFGGRSQREEELLRATIQLTARTKIAEDRADALSTYTSELLEELARERAFQAEITYLRSQVQALTERIAESADIANARISAMLDRSSYGFVEGSREDRRTRDIAEVLRSDGRPSPYPPQPRDGVSAAPPPDLLDPVTYGEDRPAPLREGETRIAPPVDAPEVPPPFIDDLLGQKMIDLYEKGFVEPPSDARAER